MKFDISKVKALGAGILASGKKNAPTLMTAGSIVLGWVGVYLFWKESKKAEQKIEHEEEQINYVEPGAVEKPAHEDLPLKEKLIIYAEYCWPAAVCGLASTGLAIGANSISLGRIAELTLLAQAMTDKSDKQKVLIDKLKEKVPRKEVMEIQQDIYRAEEDEEEIVRILREMKEAGDTRTLFRDESNGHLWKRDLNKVVTAIDEFNTEMRKRRSGAIRKELEQHKKESDLYKKELKVKKKNLDKSIKEIETRKKQTKDPFFAESDLPWKSDETLNEELLEYLRDKEMLDDECDSVNEDALQAIEEIEDIYSTGDVSDFMYVIGESSKPGNTRVGEVMEFRCFGDEPAVPQSILNFDVSYRKKYFDDDPTTPNYCVIDYMDYIYPSHEFTERGML